MVIALPVLLVIDGKVDRTDSVMALVLYGLLLISVQSKKGFIGKLNRFNQQSTVKVGRELFKILFGVATIFVASRFVVEQTHYFSNLLNVSPFLISLLFIAIGTNLPELSLVARSAFMRNHQVAFGDYVGSAAFNTFLLGLLTLIYGRPVILSNSYTVSLLFLIVGLLAFYYFARTKHIISRREAIALLALYVAFISTEVVIHAANIPT